MSNFYTILTNIGAALHANAQVQQTTVAWTHMALGDGNGNPVVPQQTQAGLVREVHRLPITSLEQHPDNPNWIVVEAVVPSDVGGWTVRETALYGGAGGGSCIAVGNYPATYKPVLAEGAAREMVMRMVIEVSSVATVKLVIDPAVAIASRKWVESLVATPAKAGLVKLATVDEAKEGLRGDVAVTPEGLDAALDGIGDRVSVLEGGFGQLVFSGNATLTATDNKIVMTGVVPAIALEKGDVIQIEGAGAQNAKLRTIESLHTNGNEVQVNYEHCGARGNGSLKLEDFTGPVTIKRIAKWYNAPLGLGQDWVKVKAFRALSTLHPNTTQRCIGVAVLGYATAAEADVLLEVGGIDVAGYFTGPAFSGAGASSMVANGSSYKIVATGSSAIETISEMR
ncbi:phage tail protein [Comamonas aquatica]|uniref:phage tail protein n=1 Tax=Comamonas aquatica TaxID=225991 RepID=UPI0006945938|nr:phage tail protein [Comamonas aquatica]